MSDIYVQAQLCVRYRIHTIWTGADLVRLACWCEPTIGTAVLCMYSARVFIFTLILPSLYPLTHFCLPLSPTAWLFPALTVISLEKDIFSGGFQWNLDRNLVPPNSLMFHTAALEERETRKQSEQQNVLIMARRELRWGKCIKFLKRDQFTGETSESLFSKTMKVYFSSNLFWAFLLKRRNRICTSTFESRLKIV